MRLRLGGFQKNTLIDFPGVVASLVFTQGCNFRCPYCHNPGLIKFVPSESSSLAKTFPDSQSIGNSQSVASIKKNIFNSEFTSDIKTVIDFESAVNSPSAITNSQSTERSQRSSLKYQSSVLTPFDMKYQPSPLTSLDISYSLIDESEVFNFLKKREGLIDGVAITGGEPTLQPALEAFCFRLKNMGLKVKVDTNGSRPEVLENLFRRELVDFVAMDIKSDQTGYQYLARDLNCPHIASNSGVAIKGADQPFDFSRIIKSIKLIIEQSPAHEFRTTCVRPFVTPEIMPKIGKMIKGASHYVLQHCSQNISMLNPAFFKKLNQSSRQPPFFTDDELEELKNLVKSYVSRCSIR
ncbi:MAG: radical SAM protein [Desulfamplus sp.]|nr:radical SAM protein [Desulfamplus sp.]MBF0257716.1 radical SAM protein [Desulfamplus sp.]